MRHRRHRRAPRGLGAAGARGRWPPWWARCATAARTSSASTATAAPALGHARLSIIDLATGQQPLSNEDGTLWVVFNGEIFNYVELREELVALGHRFRTQSDTEVIVHAYEAWGERGLRALQRAVRHRALGLGARATLVLARDPLGVRPLYLCEHGGRLLFASEVKAIFAADPSIPRAFDPVGLAETFTFWTVVPPQSVFAGVSELAAGPRAGGLGRRVPATLLLARRAARSVRRSGFQGSLEDAAAQVRAALEDAVRLRMLRADVPVGSYLSGGLDSSLVAALGRQVKGDRFLTFSLRFEDAEYDETPFQREVAARIESDHRELVVRREDIAAVFPEVVAPRRAPAPAHRAGAAVPALPAGARVGDQGGPHRRGRRRDVRRLRPLPRGQGAPLLGPAPGLALRPRLLERLYPYLARSPVSQRAMAQEFFGRDRERWAEPGFAHQPRWQATAALQRLFRPELRQAAQGGRRGRAPPRLAARPSSAAGRSWRRTSTWRCARSSPATCCRRRATGC